MEEPRAVLEADMFNTTAYGKDVVKCIQSVEYVLCSLRSGCLVTWKLLLCQCHHFDVSILILHF